MKYKIESSEPAKISSLPFSVISNPLVSLQKFSDIYHSDFIDKNSHTTNSAKYLTRQLVLEASVQISSDHILENVFSVIEPQPCSSMHCNVTVLPNLRNKKRMPRKPVKIAMDLFSVKRDKII